MTINIDKKKVFDCIECGVYLYYLSLARKILAILCKNMSLKKML
jgi:hypothetical protein